MGERVSAFTDDALGNMDAVAIADAIAKKKISVQEATEAAIARAEKVNGTLNAIVVKTYDDARHYLGSTPDAALYGVPTFIKDNLDLLGYPTQNGTGVYRAKKAKRSSGFVRQFLSTGLNYIGKTTMPEFGLICSTENEKWGITRNPWNTDYTTGGSSSGSAAMVASGVVAIASANDGAGSTRIPASCCGLVGLKPSRKRLIQMEGSTLLPLQIVYQGVLTRTVRDTAAFFAAAEKFYRNPKLPEIGHVQHAGKERLKIAFLENLPAEKTGHQDEETYRVQVETAKLLTSMGHHVEQVPVPIDIEAMSVHYLNYYGMLAYLLTHAGKILLHAKVNREDLEPFTLGLSRQFQENITRLPNSIKQLKQKGKEAEKYFEQFDVLMTPVTSQATPELGFFSPHLSYEEIAKRAVEFASYTGLQNVTGSPAIALPLGRHKNGMPIGVHFSAPMGKDKRLLELAYELEEARPWQMLYHPA